MDLNLTASGSDLTTVGPIIGEKLPAADNLTVQGRLTGSAKVLSLSEAQGSAHRGGLSLVLDGGTKDLLNFSGVALAVKGSGKDLSEVEAIIDKKLPATEKFAVEGRLTGSFQALALKEAQGSATYKFKATGLGAGGVGVRKFGKGKTYGNLPPCRQACSTRDAGRSETA